MGVLEHGRSGRYIALTRRSVIGRSATCHVRVDDRHASAEHAVLSWNQGGWYLRDLGSTNGTWLAETRIGAAERVPIAPGAEIWFGERDELWRLIDEGAPGPAAVREDGELRRGDGQTITLGADVRVHMGERGAWELVRAGAGSPAYDGDSVVVARDTWRLLLPPADPGIASTTRRRSSLPALAGRTLEFVVSRDEERVDVRLVGCDGEPTPLPSGRSCQYVLATLARLQLDATARGQTWVDVHDLASRLRYTVERVNVEIHRARRVLARSGVPDAFDVVERSKDGRLRLGTDFTVRRAL